MRWMPTAAATTCCGLFLFAAAACSSKAPAEPSSPPSATTRPSASPATRAAGAATTTATTRPRVHDSTRWEKDIQRFEAADRAAPPPKGAVLFTGSSTIAMWKTLAEDFPEQPVINRGFGGSQIVDVTHYADRVVFPYAPRLIVLRSGGNDIHAGKSAEQVFDEFKAFAAKVRSKQPGAGIAFISLFPTIARWGEQDRVQALNRMVKSYAAATPGITYIDCDDMTLGPDGKPRPELFRPDKLHLSEAGYKLLAERVRPHLAR